MNLYRKIFGRLRNYFRLILLGDRFVLEIRRWKSDNGDKTRRFAYELAKDCVVFDVGGYEGAWANEISSKSSCKVFIFEPVPEFAAAIQNKFLDNAKINVCHYGLSSRNEELPISLEADGSSFYVSGASRIANAKVRKLDFELLNELGVGYIDLMKVNIEGGEYDLLDFMILNGTIALVRNLQIQFHNFVPNAIERRDRIRRRLALTHSETWCYEFVWENWALKNTSRSTSVDD